MHGCEAGDASISGVIAAHGKPDLEAARRHPRCWHQTGALDNARRDVPAPI